MLNANFAAESAIKVGTQTREKNKSRRRLYFLGFQCAPAQLTVPQVNPKMNVGVEAASVFLLC